jgi:trimethylamine-N-oxide reductase (cytochrome c)
MHSQLDCTNNRQRGQVEDREPMWINPVDAKKCGVKNGDICLVESRRGKVLAGAIVTERVIPGTIVIHHGAWFDPQVINRQLIDVHGNANTLVLDKPTSKLARGNLASTANVRVTVWSGSAPALRVFVQPDKTARTLSKIAKKTS